MASQGWKVWKPEYNGTLLEKDLPEPYIETFTGTEFHFLNPTMEMIHIEDIAHALANQCRFTGHSSKFYSVAEHSVKVANLCENKMAGLLHDASEAYLTDVASPVKPYLSNYKEMEDTIMKVIAKKFSIPYPFEEEIHIADKVQLATEASYLVKSKGASWPKYEERHKGIVPIGWSPEYAERAFLDYFRGIL